MDEQIWRLQPGNGPLVATAIHDGHEARDEIAALFALSASERLREEDPFTANWVRAARTQVIGLRSRFEVDLNRPRDKAVYVEPEDAWGLQVWKESLPEEAIARSLAGYDAFYAAMAQLFGRLTQEHGRFVVFDLHTYNHRRAGPDAPPAPAAENPEVNIGTGTMPDERWRPIIERFCSDLRAVDFFGRRLDVRENVKFRGGNFARWTHETFPGAACVLSIEFKKFFMDEWMGRPDEEQVAAIGDALGATVPGVLQELARL